MQRILFILKQRDNYFTCDDTSYSERLSSGLTNSARFVNDMLVDEGFESKMIQVVDNNDIDREVRAYAPDVVVIEAFWVVPEKFEILAKLHPNVRWIVRNHSKIPFLATEGVGMDWSLRYMNYPNVYISSNSLETTNDMQIVISASQRDWSAERVVERTPYLPNFYPIQNRPIRTHQREDGVVNMGCFGAIRPLKNHLIQAVGAIKYAELNGLHLNFHINSTRIESSGSPVLKNLRQLFEQIPHDLVEHNWMPHHEFVKIVSRMDVGLQTSYSETFNIVTADLVERGIPVVVSAEIDWVESVYHADPNSSDSIMKAIGRALFWEDLGVVWDANLNGLKRYNEKSKKHWIKFLDGLSA